MGEAQPADYRRRRRTVETVPGTVSTSVLGVITEIDGVRVGHWTGAGTGCTVVVFPDGTVASGEVRGGAPATREFALLEPGRMVERLDALVLTGGSAFGLATADGVMHVLRDQGVGFTTAGGPVPIVVAMAVYDLVVAEGPPPGPAEGAEALAAATAGSYTTGQVGAGAGATVGKWRGPEQAMPGGLGSAVMRSGDLLVGALVVVNASGDIGGEDTLGQIGGGEFVMPEVTPFENTTIALAVTNAKLTKLQCRSMAEAAHDGFARAIVPVHTDGDGDAVVAAATGGVEADVRAVRLLTVAAVEAAIRSQATSQ